MAASKAFFSLFLAFYLFVSGVLGGITCEELDRDTCAFAVSTDGYRCVLEKHAQGEEYSCITSGVEASIGVAGWVESEECVAACGLDRHTLGISSDSLRNVRFLRRLCSPQCSKNCRNIHDLYFNVAAGEGIFLPYLCQVKGGRRQMVETREKSGTSTNSAPSPTSSTVKFGRKLIHDDDASAPMASSTMGTDNDDDTASAPLASSTMSTDSDEDAASAPVASSLMRTDNDDDAASGPVGSTTMGTDDDEDDASAPVASMTMSADNDEGAAPAPSGP